MPGEGGPVPYCPSARPDMPDAVAFGVVGGTATAPRVGYLESPLPVTPELLALADPVEPTEVFRFAAPCAGGACAHFDGSRCRLGARLVAGVAPGVSEPPACRLRSRCRWWGENGADACLRCALVVTLSYHPSESLRGAATPPAPYDEESP